ncbi:uncharacterized protein PITG_22548 [Phytophthora infestans T30-4]|uniref:FAT domain-containing protein n=1 Tax=Phytophthora infestans (strain T30-4) TaxID=403677 RepID=D0RMH6_PHYIT|nr:uncharacterized protein PITG_22548 [Phytophthora infestans T30-4]EEY63442.1 hypothetical protein PITG_22548 [Phytophthora infestans T30-4]|eukprot:XP_002909754.1 hypothetical protein PITG_22548 [Phytophthora infestans T30-4]
MAMVEGFQEASVDTWLDVIPQLIARIDTPNPKTSELLHDLLSRIGQAHPQALIYPITESLLLYVDIAPSSCTKLTWCRVSSFAWLFCGTNCGMALSRKRRSISSTIVM